MSMEFPVQLSKILFSVSLASLKHF